MCVTYVKITELRTDTTGEPPSLSKSTIRCKKYVRIFFLGGRGEGGVNLQFLPYLLQRTGLFLICLLVLYKKCMNTKSITDENKVLRS